MSSCCKLVLLQVRVHASSLMMLQVALWQVRLAASLTCWPYYSFALKQLRIAASSPCYKFALRQYLPAASSPCCKLGRPHLPTGHLTAPPSGAKRAFDAYGFLSSSVSVTIVLTLSLAKEASDELCCMTTSLHIKLLPSHDAAVSPLLQAHYAATRPVASSPCCKFDMLALLQFCSTASSQCSKFSLLQVCCAATSPCCKLALLQALLGSQAHGSLECVPPCRQAGLRRLRFPVDYGIRDNCLDVFLDETSVRRTVLHLNFAACQLTSVALCDGFTLVF